MENIKTTTDIVVKNINEVQGEFHEPCLLIITYNQVKRELDKLSAMEKELKDRLMTCGVNKFQIEDMNFKATITNTPDKEIEKTETIFNQEKAIELLGEKAEQCYETKTTTKITKGRQYITITPLVKERLENDGN